MAAVTPAADFDALFTAHPSPMLVYDPQRLKLLAANQAFCTLFGLEPDAALSLPLLDLFASDERERARSAIATQDCSGEWRQMDRVGRCLQVRLHSQPMRFEGMDAWLCVIEDLGTHRRSQLRDRSRLALMESLALGAGQQALLTQLVLAHEQLFPDSLCSILLLTVDGQHFTAGAAPHLPDFYNEAVEGLQIGPKIGSCGAAAFSGQRVIVENIAEHENWRPYRELAARAGLAACWSEPIVGPQGRVLGTFAIYRRRSGGPSLEELEHLSFSVQLAATAILQGNTLQQLRDSERRLRSILSALPDMVWLKDTEGRYLACNISFERWTGCFETQLRGQTELAFADAAEAERVRRSDALVVDTRRAQADERWLQGARPEQRALFDIVKTPLLDEHGQAVGIVGIARDITESRHREARMQRLNRSYALLSGVNEAIIRERDTLRLFAEVCRIAVEVGGFRMAWVGRVSEDGIWVRPISHAGHEQGYLDALQIELAHSPGPTARALRSGVPQIANDITTDALMAPWREAALSRGYRASAAFPISAAGRTEHALMVYANEAGHFDAEQVELLIRLAQDLALALAVDEAEAGRRKEQRLNRQLFESVAGAFFVLDPRGQVKQWNRRLEEMSGYAANEIAQRPAVSYFSSDEQPLILSRIAEGFERGEASVEATLLRKDGGGVPCLFVVRRLDDAQEPLLVGTGIDISDRVRSDQELQRHRRHLEELVAKRTAELEAANARLSREDERLRAMLALSQRASQLSEQALLEAGIEEIARLSGSPVAALHLMDEQQGQLRTLAGAWTRSTPAGIRMLAERTPLPGSPPRPWEAAAQGNSCLRIDPGADNHQAANCPPGVERVLAVPVQGRQGLRLVLCVANKPSDYDEADERDLNQLAADLWEIVERRRIELALQEAKQAADAANQAKSAFLANMSHEIRTPMNAVLGFAHLLRREPLSAAQQEHLNKISDASQHLLQVINDILDFSKIEAHKIALEPLDFELRASVERVRAMLADRAIAKRIGLRLEVAPECPRLVHGDRLRLEQILLNLISNAVKFTEQGGVQVRVLPHGEGRLRFEVLDSGIGMSAAQIEHLFEAFQQADASITRRFGGTGLGLAISRRLARLMQGDIGVSSQPGQGSCFWLELPLPTASDERGLAPALSQPGQASVRLRPARILLAEDNPINQEVACALLEELHMEVDLADHGAMALQMVQQRPYALVLMDVQMPEMDGLQATRAIRQLPTLARLPIVAMTANAFAEDRAQCLSAGMSDYLAKPVDPDALRECLLRWLPTELEACAAPGGPQAPIDWPALLKLLEGLQPLLITYDTAAAELIEQHQALIAEALGEDGRRFVTLVLDFCFAEAEELLLDLLRHLRHSLGGHAKGQGEDKPG